MGAGRGPVCSEWTLKILGCKTQEPGVFNQIIISLPQPGLRPHLPSTPEVAASQCLGLGLSSSTCT